MKFAVGVLVVILVPRGDAPRPFVPPAPPPASPEPFHQEWLADPVLPDLFAGAVEVEWPDEALSFDVPPLARFSAPTRLQEEAESSFPRGITGLDVERWRQEDEIRRIREWVSEGALGIPTFVPQLILESLLPRGLSVGPSTFLYRTSPSSSTLALVVFDQILFHEAEFLAQAQARAMDDPYSSSMSDLSTGHRRVLRRSFMGGFRATYAMPGLTLDLVLQTAAEQGALGYLLAPSIGGALLYFKGIDQNVRLHQDLKVRFKIASGREWVDGVRSDDGVSCLSFDVRFCDFPVGLIASFDLSGRGMTPAFIGIGTSLSAVEQLLGRDDLRR
jgi:hypothetical protein